MQEPRSRKVDSGVAWVTKHYGSFYNFFIKGETSLRFWELIASGAGLVNSFLVLSFLSVYQFGLYQLVLAFVGLVGGLSLDQFDGAVSVEMRSYFNRGDKRRAKRIFSEYVLVKVLLSVCLFIAVFLGADLVAKHYGSDIGLFVKIASVLLIVEVVLSVERIFLKSVFSFVFFAVTAVRELSKLVLLVLLILAGEEINVAAILTVHLMGWLIAAVFLSVFFLLRYREVFRDVAGLGGQYLFAAVARAYGKLVLLRYGFARLTKNATPWLVKFFVNTEAVSFYSLAINLIAFIEELFPINMLSYVFQAKMGNRAGLRRVFNRSVKYAVWLGAVAAAAGFLIVPLAVSFLLPKYVPSLFLFKLMLAALPIFGVYKILKWVLTTLREYRILALRTAAEAVIIFLVLVIFLPTIGLAGAGLAYIATYLARVMFLYSALVKAHPYLRFNWREMARFDRYDRDFLKNFLGQVFSILGGWAHRSILKNKSNAS